MLPLPAGSPASSDFASRYNLKMLGKLGYVPGWEGLRGIAVSYVMISHVVLHKEMLGTLGVGIFFVLSGFLITGGLMSKIEKNEQAQRDQSSSVHHQKLSRKRFAFLPEFYSDRFVRLTPALAIMVVSITYIGLQDSGRPKGRLFEHAFSAFFYLHNMWPVKVDEPRVIEPGLFLQTWSLAVEEQFYIFWSLVIPFIIPLSLKGRAKVMGSLIFASFYVRYFSGYNFLTDRMYGIDYRYAYTSNAFKMFIGCAARLLPMPEFFTRKWVGVVSTLYILISGYMWGWGAPVWYDFRTSGAWLELFTSFMVLLVVTGSVNGNPILESKFFRFPGRISYSWYLWQFPINSLWYEPASDFAPTGLAFMVATFTTFMIEEPIRNKYHAWKSRKAALAGGEEKQHARRED